MSLWSNFFADKHIRFMWLWFINVTGTNNSGIQILENDTTTHSYTYVNISIIFTDCVPWKIYVLQWDEDCEFESCNVDYICSVFL